MSLCIFCRVDASSSRSVEHIIPESLGNTRHTLRPGIVCDKCNNYFATKVEKPFLETEAIQRLRFHEEIPSKRGRVPPASLLLLPEFPVTMYKLPRSSGFYGILDVSPEAAKQISSNEECKIFAPVYTPDPPQRVVSRFLAKAAIEMLGSRLAAYPAYIDDMASEPQLDAIRNHARRGEPADWPIHTRRLYPADARIVDNQGKYEQVVHESDILVTPWSEWFYVLCVFGLELVINYGGPEVSGYQRWLSENDGRSPLYSGRNAAALPTMP